MQDGVDERRPPRVAYDLRADNDVPELTRQPVGKLVQRVDRECERVRLLVDPEMVALQRSDLVGVDECKSELALVDTLAGEHATCQLDRRVPVDVLPASVLDLDVHHAPYLLRCVPVFSAWRLYASTIRWTSLCRTTSSCPNRTNAMPSIEPRMSCTWISPEACSRGRSICVTSPVTTTFEPKPSRVRNICICSGDVFCASSRMMNESFSVRPRMNASGATSTVPLSRYAWILSASSMSYRASNSGRRY